MATGKVKWFREDKGYGFILPDDGTDDVFVHISAVRSAGRNTLTAEQKLDYDTEPTPKGPQATNLEFIEEAPSGAAASGGKRGVPRGHSGGSGAVRKQGTGGGDRSRVNQAAAPHKIQGYERDGEGLVFDTGLKSTDRRDNPVPVKVESLKVTDRFLAARPGSVFEGTGSNLKLVQYDPNVSDGLSKPHVDQNPYNFVPWVGDQPMFAEEPSKAKHHKKHTERYSGYIDVTFTARTPIFVPASGTRDNEDEQHTDQPREFFHCWNGQCERYAIPGASVKGSVRALFEALTNSCAGVTDETSLKWPPLYRRRSFRLFRIESLPDETTSGKVVECKYGLYDDHGTRKHYTAALPEPSQCKKTSECSFAANLFWVDVHDSGKNPQGHTHKWKKIRYQTTKCEFDLDLSTVDQFKKMKDHPHLIDHGGKNGTAASASRCFYGEEPTRHAPDYSDTIKRRLFCLKKNDLVFGIPDSNNGKLRCFGRNVNFLWPADFSALELMGNFASRKPAKQRLSDSDPAEATFGFAGAHGGDSHPFRSRVRFGTFWGPALSDDKLPNRPCLQLMPLTAPSGTKAKSRTLYLNPGKNGSSADHDKNAKLRGRKFYWHQRSQGNCESDDIPLVHRFDAMKKKVPEEWKQNIKNQLRAPIRPLPEKTEFKGKVHYNNLTASELGALLISCKPDLAFPDPVGTGSEPDAETNSSDKVPRYGLKLGKGKPRGLGSVTSNIELHIDCPAHSAYRGLDSCLTKEAEREIQVHVCAYKNWIDKLDLVEALKALLLVPTNASARVYPPHFSMYGWLPKENDPDGSPKSKRPDAMTPAHKMDQTHRQ